MYDNLIDCFDPEHIGNKYLIKYLTVTEEYASFWDLHPDQFEIAVGKRMDEYWDSTNHFNYNLLEDKYKVYKEELVIIVEDRIENDKCPSYDIINLKTGRFLDYQFCHVISKELKIKGMI